jgi:hypothetical protein
MILRMHQRSLHKKGKERKEESMIQTWLHLDFEGSTT